MRALRMHWGLGIVASELPRQSCITPVRRSGPPGLHTIANHQQRCVEDTIARRRSFTRSVLGNASVVSDAPHSKNAGRFGTSCGARPIQLFEGSRPWVEQTLWILNAFWS